MHILGISAFYHDSAAALVRDREIVAAAQEERFTRKKHDESFPGNAVRFCLAEAAIEEGVGKKAVVEHLPPNPVDMPDTSADIAKAGRILAWEPSVSPQEGFRRTARWHLENADWLGQIDL